MALKATIYKAELTISDMDRGYYHTHQLTIAQHPSETLERMMVRIAVFSLWADEHLEFTKGLSTDEEPDLWAKNYNGDIDLWVELGNPDEKRLRKACGRAGAVKVYGYHGHAFDIWWQQNEQRCRQLSGLSVYRLSEEVTAQLEAMVTRTMRLQATIQDGTLWLSDENTNLEITPELLSEGSSK